METDGPGALGPRRVPSVIAARCSGCGRCVAVCPPKIISLETAGYRKTAVISRGEDCTGCGECAANCLLDAIE
ncbi:MAG: 4Fe-4S dicluster domain-containing protein [Geobacteraceae bacterium]|nr:4Fe-4S dicluster domain-containing protein [Geobacteraceae bacterium]